MKFFELLIGSSLILWFTYKKKSSLILWRDRREASVALKVWQPEVIRGRQKQIVEQCVVPVESRVHALQMELRLCKQQISGFEKALVSLLIALRALSCYFPYSSVSVALLYVLLAERGKTKA